MLILDQFCCEIKFFPNEAFIEGQVLFYLLMILRESRLDCCDAL